jgi:flagellar basal-body rod protein FlgG
MLQAIYSALSGLLSEQYSIDVIGNNVANINTTAFKSGRADFADMYYQAMKRPREAGDYLRMGSGMHVGAVQHDLTTGAYVMTGNPLDFMLDGPGYFAVRGPQGVLYTRDGSFKVSAEAGGNYLVTAEGYRVLGTNGLPVAIPADISQVSADSAGNLYYGAAPFAALRIVSFPNPEGLMDAGGNKLTQTVASGAPGASAAILRQGWLEGSNVDLAGEMTRLMSAQKAYAVLGTAIRTADDMEAKANSMSE